MSELASMTGVTSQLVVIEKENIPALFSVGGCDPVLKRIKGEAAKFVPDLATEPGRKAIGSFAHKIARSKTYLDGLGKDLVADIKQQVKVVDAERKKVRDELDELKEDVRRPLTEWENVEKKRIEDIKTWIQEIVTKGEVEYDSLDDVKSTIDELEAIKVDEPIDGTYGEFAGLAARKIQTAITNLSAIYIVRKSKDDAAAEAQRLEAKRIEDERIARDKEVAEQAAEDARNKAEKEAAEAAKEEKLLADKKLQDEKDKADEKDRLAKKAIADAEAKEAAAKIAATKAEREKKEAADKAVKNAEAARKKADEDKASAVEAEKLKAEEEKQLEEDARLKREADVELRAKIEVEILEDLWAQVQDEEKSLSNGVNNHVTAICDAMIAGKIRHVKVMF